MSQTLYQALEDFATVAGVDKDLLFQYADEDDIGGVDTGWYVGSLWSVEGRFLYAVIRALNITRVLEIGVNVGCSTTHLLKAAIANGGTVTSLDVLEGSGRDIPDDLRPYWQFVAADAVWWMENNPTRHFELVFEDGPHDKEFTSRVVSIAQARNTHVIVGHDSEHKTAGPAVKGAWEAVYGPHGYTSTLVDPSDCGLAWRVNDDDYLYFAQLEG